MSLTFKPGWNREKPNYAASYGPYQHFLDLVKEEDVKLALKVAAFLYHEGPIGQMIRAAIERGGDRVEVEQGSHQLEPPKDPPGRRDLRSFDRSPNRTLHFTIRHYPGGAAHGKAFHCYLSQNQQRTWAITSISYFQAGVGLEMGQTGARDFMNMLNKRFILAHGRDDD